MPPRYDKLVTTVLRPDATQPMERTYYSMAFPGHWKPPLRRLAAARTGRKSDSVSIPIASLNAAVTAVVPDCVVTLEYAGRGDDDQPWLLAYQAIDARVVYGIVGAWIRSQRRPDDELAEEALASIRIEDLSWTPLSVDLTSPDLGIHAMRLLPMEIAAMLSKPGVGCPHGDLTFRRCTTDTGAEVMSWPPLGIENKKPYSIMIGITSQTVPTSDELYPYLRFGVRRWLPRKGKLSLDHRHSVYLAPTLPYLPELDNSGHFARAMLKTYRDRSEDTETRWSVQWDEPMANVLGELGCLGRLPNPQQLADKPLEYMHDVNDVAAIVYQNGMLERDPVKSGLSVADRAPLLDWVTDLVGPSFRLLEPRPRATNGIVVPTKRPAAATTESVPAFAHAIASVVGPRLDIELLTPRGAATVRALRAIEERLEVTIPPEIHLDDDPVLFETGPLTVGLSQPNTGRFLADLDRGADGKSIKVREAVQQRITEITRAFPKAKHPTVALCELAGLDVYKGPKRNDDPKSAIRHGLMRTGRLSQFVTPVQEWESEPSSDGGDGKDPDQERFSSAVADLFRQLGVRPTPLPSPNPDKIEQPPALLAIWIIRKNKTKAWGRQHQVPVALLADPSGQHVTVRAPDVGWQPLHHGLPTIGERYVEASLSYSRDDVQRFIATAIKDVVGGFDSILLLSHAQNFRSVWPNLTNGNMRVDTFGFGPADAEAIASYPGLRHVRVRTDDNHETPECYGIAENVTGLPGGLWHFMGDRVYGSVGTKPVSASSALKGISKIVPNHRGGKSSAPRPGSYVWNPQFVELLVAGIQEGDRPDAWAGYVHELRNLAPYVDKVTQLPWPLHLAPKVEEYLLPTNV